MTTPRRAPTRRSADIDIKDDPDKTVLEIQTNDTELVIGRRGARRPDARQHHEPVRHAADLTPRAPIVVPREGPCRSISNV
jgi:hypothetical protein